MARQYRFLLRTAPADALEAAHTEALPLLSEANQESLLETLRGSLLVGDRLTTKDHAKIARLVTNGERRAPGRLLTALPAQTLQDLAESVLDSEASFGLLGGYAEWDGVDPEPADESAYEGDGFDPDAGDSRTKRLGADGSAPFLRPAAIRENGAQDVWSVAVPDGIPQVDTKAHARQQALRSVRSLRQGEHRRRGAKSGSAMIGGRRAGVIKVGPA